MDFDFFLVDKMGNFIQLEKIFSFLVGRVIGFNLDKKIMYDGGM